MELVENRKIISRLSLVWSLAWVLGQLHGRHALLKNVLHILKAGHRGAVIEELDMLWICGRVLIL